METQGYVPITYEKRNVLECVMESVGHFPDRPAVISSDGRVRLSYRDLNERANRLANALIDLGVEKGNRVAIFQTNTWQYAEQYLAIMKMGAICVPMNFRLKSAEALFILTDAGANVLLFEERYTPMFQEIRPYLLSVKHYVCTIGKVPEWAVDYEALLGRSSPADPPAVDLQLDSICSICYTSGTTGLPKGSISTHRNIMVNFYDDSRTLRKDYLKHPELGYGVMLIIVPVYHIAGILSLYISMSFGHKIVIPDTFTPEKYMQLVEREKVTSNYLVPTMFAMILDHPGFGKYDISSLRFINYGAMAHAAGSSQACPQGLPAPCQIHGCLWLHRMQRYLYLENAGRS